MIKFIDSVKKEELKDKKVLMRTDLNVPLTQLPTVNHQLPIIAEKFRIKAQKETLDYLVGSGAKVLLVAHLNAGDSFLPITEQIGEILGHTLTLVSHSELGQVAQLFSECSILLLDNIRQDPREEKNDKELALRLSEGFDFYVNNDFSVCHRNHASVSAISEYLPSYAGLQIRKETENLAKALNAPIASKVLVLGGAKISTKLPVIKNFIDKAEKILVGGAIANNFFRAQGIDVGSSLVDDSVPANLVTYDVTRLPEDVLISRDKARGTEAEPYPIKDLDKSHAIVDIGPETAKHFSEIIKKSSLTIWNGPMGISEVEKFSQGTKVIAEAVVKAKHSIVGGGDTIAAIDKLGLLDKFSYVSTGGGAMLAFLAGEELPGLKALGYYKK